MSIQANPSVQNGALITGVGTRTLFNISSATVVKTLAGRVAKISVTTAGSAPGSVNDAKTTGTAGAANLLASIPNTVGVYSIDMPTAVGIVVTPGTGQVLTISYS